MNDELRTPSPAPWIVDFDDFEDVNTGFRWLFHLKQREPNFKATLFCVTARTSPAMLAVLKSLGWLEPAMHGWNHSHLECGSWKELDADEFLQVAEMAGYAKVFRAPYWEISDGTYRALRNRGWICADHPKNRARRPEGLKIYEAEGPGRAHGHVQNVCGNGMEEMLSFYESLHGNFSFISELV